MINPTIQRFGRRSPSGTLSLTSWFERLRRNSAASLTLTLARLSPREGWLLAILALVALAGAAFVAQQWSGAQRDRYAAAQADLMLARQARVAASRGGLDDFDLAQLRSLSSWSVHAPDIWLARIRIEQRLVVAAADARLPSPEIKLAEALETGGPVPLLKAEISGPYVGAPVLRFLNTLALDQPAFVVDKFDASDADTAQYKLTLLFPVAFDSARPAP
jgi:hypothetical protein